MMKNYITFININSYIIYKYEHNRQADVDFGI